MKLTIVHIAFVVVMILMSSLVPTKPTMIKPESTKPPCTDIEITGCVPAILIGTKPSQECCDKLKAQEPCFCDFIKNPAFTQYVSSPQARLALAACVISYPTC
ncbi:unnamed protein product [Cochlearia groenlandica]